MAIIGIAQRKKIDVSVTGAGTVALVSGVAGECIQVLSMILTSELDANIKIQSASTDLTGTIYLAARGGFALPHQPFFLYSTEAGEALNLYHSATGDFGGSIVYVQGSQ